MTRKGIDFGVLALDMKDPENSRMFASEMALKKFMEEQSLIFKKTQVEDVGEVELRERLVEDDTQTISQEWNVQYNAKIWKKTDF